MARNAPPKMPVLRGLDRWGLFWAALLSVFGGVGAPQAHGQTPEFDAALVVGRVFCDADGDGLQGSGEPGLGGARIHGDIGFVVETDRYGGFQMAIAKPGAHLLKIDRGSLGAAEGVTTPERVRVQLTAGRVERVDFGVRCRQEVVRPHGFLAEAAASGAADPSDALLVLGRLMPPALMVDGERHPMLKPFVTIEEVGALDSSRSPNIPWRPQKLDRPLRFELAAGWTGVSALHPGARWTVKVRRVDGPASALQASKTGESTGRGAVRLWFGAGRPPDEILWGGRDSTETEGVLERGGLYEVTLTISDPVVGLAVSPPALFGVSYGAAGRGVRRVFRGGMLDPETLAPTPTLLRALSGLRPILAEMPDAVVLIEVHRDATEVAELDLARTRKAGYAIGVHARRVLKLPEERLSSRGWGGARPLQPNTSPKARAFNRRVSVQIVRPETAEALGPIPDQQTTPLPSVRVQGRPLVLDWDGGFQALVPRPDRGLLAIEMVDALGGRRSIVVPLNATRAPNTPRSEGELLDVLGPPRAPGGLDATADRFEARLPPRGAELWGARLYIGGKSDLGNQISVAGKRVSLDPDGGFGRTIDLPSGASEVVIASVDSGGNRAEIRWPVTVSETEFFIMVLADGALGQMGTPALGDGAGDALNLGPITLQGRGAATFEGRISGTALAEHIRIVAHIDSARWDENGAGRGGGIGAPFIGQLIDPHRDYAVYGDASARVRGADRRGPVYIVIEAGDSSLTYGTIDTEIPGVALLRYGRVFTGGAVVLNHEWAPGWESEVRGFVSDDPTRLTRGQDRLRATGGSLYQLSAGGLIPGSERIHIVVRDRLSGLELARSEAIGDRDYRLEFGTGRLLMQSAIPSVVDGLFRLGSARPFAADPLLRGHPVFVEVTYERTGGSVGADGRNTAGVAFGVHGRQSFFGAFEVGGGVVQEGRETGPDARLVGGDLKVDWRGIRAGIEVAHSQGFTGAVQESADGGLAFHEQAAPDAAVAGGLAFRTDLDVDLGTLTGAQADLDLRIRAWMSRVEAGFRSDGTTERVGTEGYGASLTWRPAAEGRLDLRFDGGAAISAGGALGAMADPEWLRVSARYGHQIGPWMLSGEAFWGRNERPRFGSLDGDLSPLNQRDVSEGDIAGARVHIRLQATEWLSVGLGQGFRAQMALVGENDPLSMLSTEVDVGLRLTEEAELVLGGVFRWDGAHQARIGWRSRSADGSAVYLEERIGVNGRGALASAMVLGVEQRLNGDADGAGGDGGRLYGEMRLSGAASGRRDQIILGLGRRFTLGEGVSASLGYERIQGDGLGAGILSRDMAFIGVQVAGADWLRLGGSGELRFDHGDASTGGLERLQVLVRGGLSAQFDALTVAGHAVFAHTEDLNRQIVEGERLDVTVAATLRPKDAQWLMVSARYTHRNTLGPASETSHLGSLNAVIDIPLPNTPIAIRIHQKGALRWMETAGGAQTRALWVSRLGLLLFGALDVSAEYRLQSTWGTLTREPLQHGALVELGYTFWEMARLGVGYSFTRVPADLLAGEAGAEQGFFLRLSGMY